MAERIFGTLHPFFEGGPVYGRKVANEGFMEELLRQDPRAARFYDSCTPEQKQAILLQLPEMKSDSQLRAFVANLPSATL